MLADCVEWTNGLAHKKQKKVCGAVRPAKQTVKCLMLSTFSVNLNGLQHTGADEAMQEPVVDGFIHLADEKEL